MIIFVKVNFGSYLRKDVISIGFDGE